MLSPLSQYLLDAEAKNKYGVLQHLAWYHERLLDPFLNHKILQNLHGIPDHEESCIFQLYREPLSCIPFKLYHPGC